MKQYTGKCVYKGIVMGPLFVLKKADIQVKRVKVEDREAEKKRVEEGIEKSVEQLQVLYERALKEMGESSASLFETHQMMYDELQDAIFEIIDNESVNAEFAVAQAGDNQAEVFASMDDEYFKARAADVKDVSNRLIRNLYGIEDMNNIPEPSIIVAEDLTPSETVQMDKAKILAFVTLKGSANSHTSILARMMNIPALISVPVELEALKSGTMAIVDGESGSLILEPDEASSEAAKKRIAGEAEKKALLDSLKGQENVTLSGKHIDIFANIGNVNDLGYVKENDAGGIGLFRSEFLYLGREDYPTEEEQFAAYKKVLQFMAGKKVVIRTCDIGADKQVDYFHLAHEENPALGYRAIRICLTRPEMFRTQLRALLRASVYGNLSIMYPMIISVDEVRRIKKMVEEEAKVLKEKEIPCSIPEQGIMIETPASVMISDELAQEVDFFSVGTNDLTQYTLAIDRQNASLDEFLDTHHPAILRMIRMAADSAHKYGKWIGICGELGADPELTEEFLSMGIDELSVSPSMVLKLRKKVREIP